MADLRLVVPNVGCDAIHGCGWMGSSLLLFSVSAVREVAEQLIWQCLVEDPALFMRTFLEKLTNRDRRVSTVFCPRIRGLG